MESFSVNSAKSYLGKNVNLHLKDGGVIVNVKLTQIRNNELGRGRLLEYIAYGNRKVSRIPLKNIAWAEQINLSFFQLAA
jgi:hypothetical protein